MFNFRREGSNIWVSPHAPGNTNNSSNSSNSSEPGSGAADPVARQGEPPILNPEDAGARLPSPVPPLTSTPDSATASTTASGTGAGTGTGTGTVRGPPAQVGGGGGGQAGPPGQPGPSNPAPPILTRPRAGAQVGGSAGTGGTLGGGMFGVRRDPVEEATIQQPTDSLTLGQLKAATAGMQQKQKTQQFTYRYDDTDTIMSELNEFYPYEDMPRIAKGPEKFAEDFKGTWTETSLAKRKEYIEVQLEYLESANVSVRRAAQERLLYLLQGTFAETTGPEEQLHWIMENAKTLRSVDGVTSLVTALQDANRRYTGSTDRASEKPLSTSSNGPVLHPVDPTDERNAELIDIVGMLYFVVEVFRTDESFGDELMTMSTPLVLVLFQMIAGLKDRLPKGYPVKKVLLLVWKTLLASLGGMKDVEKAKALSREQAGLPPENKNFFTKASPIDIANWRRDMSVKYTTFNPRPASDEKLADGIKPIPPRPDYHSTEIPRAESPKGKTLPATQNQNPQHPQMPGTPAPASPLLAVGQQGQQGLPGQPGKPKKQQFQTDPTRPFIFPFSSAPSPPPSYSGGFASSSSSTSAGTGTMYNSDGLVPYAIAEADKLFARHAFVSLGLFQLWQTRDECMREERGLGKKGLIGFDDLAIGDDNELGEGDMEAMRLEWKFEEIEMECKANGDKEGAKLAREKMMAVRRLRRVDLIYKHTLPIMQSCVIVLLKFLLATVTGPGAAHMTSQGGAVPPGFQSPTQEAPQPEPALPPPTKAEVDVARHREITSKAVSAILILLLKWFKASHVLKFHFLGQLLFDSNCLLLVLKMFGLNDIYHTIRVKNEWEDHNFFRYCYLNCSKSPPRPEDDILQKPNGSPRPPDTDSDVEYINDYSWRNFFSSINFLKILQKMTKHRTHRTYMLIQYKSSQILKRMLRVNQPMLQLQVLKLIKSQMPWCGRKWRQANMKVITSIYLNCRPDLKDDWLAGTDQENEIEDALEYALRSLIVFYNRQNYSVNLLPNGHRRSNSTSAVTLEDPALHPPPGEGGGGGSHQVRRSASSSSNSDRDVFPPRRTSYSAHNETYNPDEMIEFWLHEYEDVLMEVFGDTSHSDDLLGGYGDYSHHDHPHGPDSSSATVPSGTDPVPGEGGSGGVPGEIGVGLPTAGLPGAAEKDDAAWIRLGEIMRASNGGKDDDVISDSESVVTVGELGDEARIMGADGGGKDGEVLGEFARQQMDPASSGKNTWEHMSPTTLSRLPPSPHERRRSSTTKRRTSSASSPLRPVIPREPAHPHRSSNGLLSPTSPSGASGGGSRHRRSSNDHLSPTGHRRSSSRGAGEEVRSGDVGVGVYGENDNPFDDDDDENEGDDVLREGDEEEEEEDMRGPMPIVRETNDQRERQGAVDEVEYAYGE